MRNQNNPCGPCDKTPASAINKSALSVPLDPLCSPATDDADKPSQ